MRRAVARLNRYGESFPSSLRDASPSRFEQIVCDALRDECDGVVFKPSDVELVSGASFPDIVVARRFGVEVKSTSKNHWRSTGSSIVESTRVEGVEEIWMMFGKLGGDRPEVRCRPYGDVLPGIAVTHCPRYLIDMDIDADGTIFHKMSTTYDDLRNTPNLIGSVRQFYRAKAIAEGRAEMPWWISDMDADQSVSLNVGFWADLSRELKRRYQAEVLILFPQVAKSQYKEASLWLVTARSVVVPNMRDLFSAGGQISEVDGVKLKAPVAQIYRRLVESRDEVLAVLADESFRVQIHEFNPGLFGGDMFAAWLEQVSDKLGDQRIVDWIVGGVSMK